MKVTEDFVVVVVVGECVVVLDEDVDTATPEVLWVGKEVGKVMLWDVKAVGKEMFCVGKEVLLFG